MAFGDPFPGTWYLWVNDSWNTIYQAAVSAFRKNVQKNKNWFQTNIFTVISANWSALIRFKRDPSQQNSQALKDACNKAQETECQCTNDYSLQLSNSIQQASNTGSIGTYTRASNKQLVNQQRILRANRVTNKQMRRYVEHYLQQFYSKENLVIKETLNDI